MSISIVPNSAKITNSVTPKLVTRISTALKDNMYIGADGNIGFQGEVQLTGNPGDSTKSWKVGWIQALWIETSYAYYQGQKSADGSVFVQMAQPPGWKRGACRDTLNKVSSIFIKTDPDFDPATNTFNKIPPLIISPKGNSFPITVQVYFTDSPFNLLNLTEKNTLTKQPNYLQETMMDFKFCSVLTVLDPKGFFHHQAHVYWTHQIKSTFSLNKYPPVSQNDWNINSNGSIKIGQVMPNAPTDPQFANVLTTKQILSCNELSIQQYYLLLKPRNPNRHESIFWQKFDTTKP